LTEDWGEALFSALRRAGGTAFSNMAVGYNNVDVNAANKYGVAVGNTPVSFSCLLVLCLYNVCFLIRF
jgi:hydroxypyruvate reductase 1